MPPWSLHLAKLKWKLHCHGIETLPLGCVFKLLRLITNKGEMWYGDFLDRHFDHRFRTDTTGIILTKDLYQDAAAQNQNCDYQASNPVEFVLMLSRLPIEHKKYCFIDYGSGKGRALILASRLPFKKAIGVEGSEELHQLAQRNIASMWRGGQKCLDVESCHHDATTFELPRDPIVIFCYNAFKDDVMADVLRQIEVSYRQDPRHVMFVYHNPRYRQLMDTADFLKPVPLDHIDNTNWAIYETNRAAEAVRVHAAQAASLPA